MNRNRKYRIAYAVLRGARSAHGIDRISIKQKQKNGNFFSLSRYASHLNEFQVKQERDAEPVASTMPDKSMFEEMFRRNAQNGFDRQSSSPSPRAPSPAPAQQRAERLEREQRGRSSEPNNTSHNNSHNNSSDAVSPFAKPTGMQFKVSTRGKCRSQQAASPNSACFFWLFFLSTNLIVKHSMVIYRLREWCA